MKPHPGQRIYIAHPLQGDGSPEWGNKERNIRRYLAFCAYATNQGFTVVSWIHDHLMHEAGLTTPEDPAGFYLSRDLSLVAVCDAVWRCAPMEVSAGLETEVAFARAKGIPVVSYPQWDDPDYFPVTE